MSVDILGTNYIQCVINMVQYCFTSTETIGSLGRGAQDGHLDFHTAPELCEVSEEEMNGGGYPRKR